MGIVVTMVALSFTVFTVKEVELNFKTSQNIEWVDQEIIETGGFEFGKCLLFDSKKEYAINIEKQNPYLKVLNIETVFPSKFVVHLQEREECFAFQNEGNTVYLGDDLKVLKIEEGEVFSSLKTNAILLEDFSWKNEIVVGEILESEDFHLKNFFTSMIENNKQYSQVVGFCKSLKFFETQNEFGVVEKNILLKTFADREIEIKNYETSLSLKLQHMFTRLPQMIALLDEKGFSSEEIADASLIIDNQISDESEIFTHIYVNGEILAE